MSVHEWLDKVEDEAEKLAKEQGATVWYDVQSRTLEGSQESRVEKLTVVFTLT